MTQTERLILRGILANNLMLQILYWKRQDPSKIQLGREEEALDALGEAATEIWAVLTNARRR